MAIFCVHSFTLLHSLFVFSASLSSFASCLALEEESIIDPELLKGETTQVPDKFTGWTDWEEWTPSPDLVKAFPYYRMGYDNDGLVGRFLFS